MRTEAKEIDGLDYDEKHSIKEKNPIDRPVNRIQLVDFNHERQQWLVTWLSGHSPDERPSRSSVRIATALQPSSESTKIEWWQDFLVQNTAENLTEIASSVSLLVLFVDFNEMEKLYRLLGPIKSSQKDKIWTIVLPENFFSGSFEKISIENQHIVQEKLGELIDRIIFPDSLEDHELLRDQIIEKTSPSAKDGLTRQTTNALVKALESYIDGRSKKINRYTLTAKYTKTDKLTAAGVLKNFLKGSSEENEVISPSQVEALGEGELGRAIRLALSKTSSKVNIDQLVAMLEPKMLSNDVINEEADNSSVSESVFSRRY